MVPRQVESIEINLSGLETVIVHKDFIGYFEANYITRSIKRDTLLSLGEQYVCEELFVQLSSEVNNSDNYMENEEIEPDMLPFARLDSENDVVSLKVNYDNGSEDYIHFRWYGDEEGNKAQTSVINGATGDLYLTISLTESAHTYFEEELEDKRIPKIWRELKKNV